MKRELKRERERQRERERERERGNFGYKYGLLTSGLRYSNFSEKRR